MVLFFTKSDGSRRSARAPKITNVFDGCGLSDNDTALNKIWIFTRHFSLREKASGKEKVDNKCDVLHASFSKERFSLRRACKARDRTRSPVSAKTNDLAEISKSKLKEEKSNAGFTAESHGIDPIFTEELSHQNQKYPQRMLATPASAHRSLPRNKETLIPTTENTSCVQKVVCPNRTSSNAAAFLLSRHSISAAYLSSPASSSSSPDDSLSSPTSFLKPPGQMNCTSSTTSSGSSPNTSYGASFSAYELSTDFWQKQVELLEKKYGGKVRTHRAAAVIQRAYRRHCLGRKFQLLLSKRRHLPLHKTAKGSGEYETEKRAQNDRQVQQRSDKSKLFSPDDAYGSVGTKLKLHSYNVNSGSNAKDSHRTHHLTAPLLTTQLKLDRRRNDDYFDRSVRTSNTLIKLDAADRKIERRKIDNVAPEAHLGNNCPEFASHSENVKHQAREGQIYFGGNKKRSVSVENQPKKGTLIYAATSKQERSLVDASVKHSTCPSSYGTDVDLVDCLLLDEERTYFSYNINNACASGSLGFNANLNNVIGYTKSVQPDQKLAPSEQQQYYQILSNEKDILTDPSCPGRTKDTRSMFDEEKFSWNICRHDKFKEHSRPISNINYIGKVKVNYADRCPVLRVKSCQAEAGLADFHRQQQEQHTHQNLQSVKFRLAETPTSDDSGVSSAFASRRTSPGRPEPQSPSTSTSKPGSLDSKTVTGSAAATNTPMIWLPRLPNVDDCILQPSCSKAINDPSECSRGLQSATTKLNAGWARRSLMRQAPMIDEVERKRQYRIALNFFNKKPERGINFLIKWNFVEPTPAAISKFLLTRKGLSRQMIGEYLGTLQNPFNMAVLDCLAREVDFTNLQIDTALRHFQSIFRLPGEAQKIERIIEVFAKQFWECNAETVKKLFRRVDTVFVLSFAIIMLNTDLHSPNVKPDKRMKVEDFIKNLRGIDGNGDIDSKYLTDLFCRIKHQEIKSGPDHVTQVLKVERSIVGKKPTIALNYRRLVCYCRLYEVLDPNKKQSPNAHQREIFLFNDMLMITKICSRKKSGVTYSFRESHCLVGLQVETFHNHYYQNGLRISFTLDSKVLYFNSRCAEDRSKFLEDLKESVLESDEMEALRIELELEKQSFGQVIGGGCGGATYRSHSLGRNEQQRDSGVAADTADAEEGHSLAVEASVRPADARKRILLAGNNTDDQERRERRASAASLDSGMSSTASVVSRDSPTSVSRRKETVQFLKSR